MRARTSTPREGTGDLRVAAAAALVSLLLATSHPAAATDGGAVKAITHVFGPYAAQAIRVARCESGLSIWARNGQYLGLFQMGDYARGRYGHSWDPWGQARAAYRYFRDAGYSWRPWTCGYAAYR